MTDTTVFIVSTSGSTQTYNVPADWNNSDNTVEAIGGGGSGSGWNGSTSVGGGGAGAYCKKTNQGSLTPGGTTSFVIGTAAAGVAGSAAVGNNGTDTWFISNSTVLAKAGARGDGNSSSAAAGGAAASCIPSSGAASGGAGGTSGSNVSAYTGGTGGGGAGGPNGAGAKGGDFPVGGADKAGSGGGAGSGGSAGVDMASSGSPSQGTNGGAGFDTTAGGTGGAVGAPGVAGGAGSKGSGGGGGGGVNANNQVGGAGGLGGSGVEWITVGAGGGGGGGGGRTLGTLTGTTGGIGGAGGAYGGGSGCGGFAATIANSGAGGTGLIILKYTSLAIAFDAASNSGYQTAQSTYSWNHTVAGNFTFLVVGISMLSVLGSSVTSITYNGISMDFIGAKSSVSGAIRTELWGQIAPTAGTHAIAVTLSAGLDSAGGAVSFKNVNQSSPWEALNSASATNVGAADATVTVTSVADNAWQIDCVATDDTAITIGAGNTSRSNVTGTLGSGAVGTAGPKTPAGGVAMSWTNVGALATWSIAGISVRPYLAANLASIVFHKTLSGLGTKAGTRQLHGWN